MMGIIGMFIGLITVTSMVIGWMRSNQVDILIEFKYLSNPFFHVGVSFNEYVREDYIEQELIIGVFFINVVVIFFKEIDA